MAKFINPFVDEGFKHIFGQEESKPFLKAFLNELLKGEHEVKDLKFLDKEQLRINKDNRSLIYDIYCEVENGDHIIVEMQNKSQPFFKNRSIFYLARSIVAQGKRGRKWKYDYKAIYIVAMLNFHREDISDNFRTDVALMDIHRLKLFSDRMRLIYLQLPLFTKEAKECETLFDKIIYVLKNMDAIQRHPELFNGPVFTWLASISDEASLTEEERIKYDTALQAYRDTYAVMEGQYEEGWEKGQKEGMKKGMKKGIEKGRKEGIEKGRREMLLFAAQQMRGMGIADAEIIKSLSIDPKDMEKL